MASPNPSGSEESKAINGSEDSLDILPRPSKIAKLDSTLTDDHSSSFMTVTSLSNSPKSGLSDEDEDEFRSHFEADFDTGLGVCPLKQLRKSMDMEDEAEDIPLDHLEADMGIVAQGPVDPVFVDEESSGEAVASAADHDDVHLAFPEASLKEPEPEKNPPLPPEKAARPPEPREVTFDVIDQVEEEESSESLDEDELHAMLEKEVKVKDDKEDSVSHEERIKYHVVEKGKNHFDVLPTGWIQVLHHSGMPIYLHKPTRVVSLARPYHLGMASARRHPIPVGSVPCLNYKKAVEEEKCKKRQKEEQEQQGMEDSKNVQSYNRTESFPSAKVESVEESVKKASLTAEEFREYCQSLFVFQQHTIKKFKSWNERRKYLKQAQRQKIVDAQKEEGSEKRRPALPKGTKIISIPVVEMEKDAASESALHQKVVRKSKKDWMLNPAGKSTVCILHEYLQHSLKKAPDYKYKEMDSAATPYCAVVLINGLEYGRGVGSSKKEAKSEAARLTLEILIPEFKDNLNSKKGYVIKDTVDLSYFDNIRIEDPRVADLCNRTSEPSPYAILLTCLQRNYGLGDTNITTNLTPARNKRNKFTMKVSQREVEVICKNKRDGKQMASQKLLQLLHPHIKSWGSLLRMYGSRAINAQKSKKERESQVTGLQSHSSAHPSPNLAILAKLREDMRQLAASKKAMAPIGKLTLGTATGFPGERSSCIDRIDL